MGELELGKLKLIELRLSEFRLGELELVELWLSEFRLARLFSIHLLIEQKTDIQQIHVKKNIKMKFSEFYLR